jgi:hypothetical protein
MNCIWACFLKPYRFEHIAYSHWALHLGLTFFEASIALRLPSNHLGSSLTSLLFTFYSLFLHSFLAFCTWGFSFWCHYHWRSAFHHALESSWSVLTSLGTLALWTEGVASFWYDTPLVRVLLLSGSWNLPRYECVIWWPIRTLFYYLSLSLSFNFFWLHYFLVESLLTRCHFKRVVFIL